jgi:hypothetical protein
MTKTALKTMLIQLDILLVKQIPRRSDPRQILPLLLRLVRAGGPHVTVNRLFPQHVLATCPPGPTCLHPLWCRHLAFRGARRHLPRQPPLPLRCCLPRRGPLEDLMWLVPVGVIF